MYSFFSRSFVSPHGLLPNGVHVPQNAAESKAHKREWCIVEPKMATLPLHFQKMNQFATRT